MVSGPFFFSAEIFRRHGFQRNDLGAILHGGGIFLRRLAQQRSHQLRNPPLPFQLFLNIPALLRQPGKRLADGVGVVAGEDRPRNRGADDDRFFSGFAFFERLGQFHVLAGLDNVPGPGGRLDSPGLRQFPVHPGGQFGFGNPAFLPDAVEIALVRRGGDAVTQHFDDVR